MTLTLQIILVLASILMSVFVLLHRGKGGGLSSLFGGGVDAVVDGRHHQVGKERHEHADLLAFAQLQVGCLRVRPIIQLFRQRANTRHHLGRCRALDPGRVAIEHPRHGGNVHPEGGCHGLQGGRA